MTDTITPVLGPRPSRRAPRDLAGNPTVADDDTDAMLDLGRTWCRTLGVDPDQPLPAIEPPAGTGVLVAAVTATLAAVTANDHAPSGGAKVVGRAAARAAEKTARAAAERAARTVFTKEEGDPPGHAPGGDTAITGTRPPTPAEQAAARRLARALKHAATRDRVTTVTTSATPPGRLRMRDALAADAQRAAGAIPTAQPFTRTTRRHVPSPPLRVGIACDVSGSMNAFAAPIASAAWILARAVSHVPDATTATVIYGQHVRPVTHPGQTPTHIREFAATDATEKFTRAVDALDAALDLTRPGAARLLVIVSDGLYTPDERATGQQRITRLRASGCGILWIALSPATHAMSGADLLILSDPAAAADTIASAATRALRHA